jgi:phosphatidylserine/phosphatidylglycerophosphate/cardiolipin synthase-like enzyme
MESLQTNYQSEIISDIRNAKHSIKVAVSWLTDTVLINELLAAQKRCDVKILLSSNELNIIRFELFQAMNGAVKKFGRENPDDMVSEKPFMHSKYYVIDDRTVKSGSYNFSFAAQGNIEELDNITDAASIKRKVDKFDMLYSQGADFFHEIEDPHAKRAELQLIQKEHKEVLTPERLAAYRQTQIVLKEQEAKHKKEIEEIERQRKEADEGRKRAEEKAANEKKERERILADQTAKEQQTQYQPKTEVKVAQVPPTSYGKL